MRGNAMPIHLVGETIDARQAHLRAQASELIPLIRAVYVARGVDVDQTIMAHGVRIAHYLYPNAYLSSASAFLLAPTEGGRLFISGRRNQRTRLRALDIVQNQAPGIPPPLWLSSVTIWAISMCRCPRRGSGFSKASAREANTPPRPPPTCADKWRSGWSRSMAP
jgi:hypothetical protein